VAKRAMLELKVLKFLVQSLMLANLAHVVLSFQDRHATSDARGEMSATVSAIDVTKLIKLIN
jgi:hypothetical protein